MESVIGEGDIPFIINTLLMDDLFSENKEKIYDLLRLDKKDLPGLEKAFSESESYWSDFLTECLMKWRSKYGRQATPKFFVKILREENFEDAADEIVETLKLRKERLEDLASLDYKDSIYEILRNSNQINTRKNVRFEIYEPVHNFGGRNMELTKLHELVRRSFCTGKNLSILSTVTVVHGLGGIGKSNLVGKFCQKYWREYDSNMVWIDGSSVQTMETCFKRFANRIPNLSQIDHKGMEETLDEIYEYFSTSKSLFIFDNVTKFEGCVDFFLPKHLQPKQRRPYFLILTRKFGLIQNCQEFAVDLFTETDTVSLITNGINLRTEGDFKLAKDLACKINNLPLAVQQAVTYMREMLDINRFIGNKSHPITNYMKLLEEKKVEILGHDFYRHAGDVYASNLLLTYNSDFSSVIQTPLYGDSAMDILNTIAYFEPENIRVDIFKNYYEAKEIEECLKILIQHSLIKLSTDSTGSTTINIHRMVQEVLRVRDKEAEVDRMRKGFNILRRCEIWKHVEHVRSLWKYSDPQQEIMTEFPKVGIQLCEIYNIDWFQHLQTILEKYKQIFGETNKNVLKILCAGITTAADAERSDSIVINYILKLCGDLRIILRRYLEMNNHKVATKFKINEAVDALLLLAGETKDQKFSKMLRCEAVHISKNIYDLNKQNGGVTGIVRAGKTLIKSLMTIEELTEDIVKYVQEIRQFLVPQPVNSDFDTVQLVLLEDFLTFLFKSMVNNKTTLNPFVFGQILQFRHKISKLLSNSKEDTLICTTCNLVLGNEEGLDEIYTKFEKKGQSSQFFVILDRISNLFKKHGHFQEVLKSLKYKESKLQTSDTFEVKTLLHQTRE